jgi:nitrate reductase NapE component
LFCVCVCIPLGIATQPDMDPTTSVVVLAVPVSLFFLIIVGGGWGFLVWTIWRRARQLDAVFGPLGLAGSTHMLTGRQYHGTVEGRQVDAYVYRGPTLELRVSTPLQTRLNAVEKAAVVRPVAWAFKYEPLALNDPGLQDLSITALDEDWARRLLSDQAVRAILQRLVAGGAGALIQQVALQPSAFSLHLYRSRGLFGYAIAPDQARQWLDDLLVLAHIAESLPAPQKTAELTSLERFAQSSRRSSTRRSLILLVVLLVVLFVLPLCIAVPVVLLLIMADSQ